MAAHIRAGSFLITIVGFLTLPFWAPKTAFESALPYALGAAGIGWMAIMYFVLVQYFKDMGGEQ